MQRFISTLVLTEACVTGFYIRLVNITSNYEKHLNNEVRVTRLGDDDEGGT